MMLRVGTGLGNVLDFTITNLRHRIWLWSQTTVLHKHTNTHITGTIKNLH
jgi:hypothetical protein